MKTNTKKSLTLLMSFLLIMIVSLGNAQEKKKEIVVATKTFDQFMLRYKFGNEKHLFRISSGYFSYNDKKATPGLYDENTYGVGLGVGMEFPKMINEKLNFYYGFELFGRYNKTIDVNRNNYSLQVSGIIGFSYYLGDFLKLGIEIDPGIYYSSSKEGDDVDNNFGIYVNNNFAEINLGFVF